MKQLFKNGVAPAWNQDALIELEWKELSPINRIDIFKEGDYNTFWFLKGGIYPKNAKVYFYNGQKNWVPVKNFLLNGIENNTVLEGDTRRIVSGDVFSSGSIDENGDKLFEKAHCYYMFSGFVLNKEKNLSHLLISEASVRLVLIEKHLECFKK